MNLKPISEHIESPTRGNFIVYEGLDGAGTSTQVRLLGESLRRAGLEVVETFEPTRSHFGAVIRHAIEARIRLSETTMALAFATDRADHLTSRGGILESLQENKWVICDRYFLSSVVYQTAAGIPVDRIIEINRDAVAPDLTIFLDTPVEECLRRLSSRATTGERYETEAVLTAALSRYYEWASAPDENNIVIVDGTPSPNQVIVSTLEKILGSSMFIPELCRKSLAKSIEELKFGHQNSKAFQRRRRTSVGSDNPAQPSLLHEGLN